MDMDDSKMPDGRLYPLSGSEVKRLRLQKGWSRPALAAKIGRSKKTVENIERRISKPVYYDTLEKVAKAFGVEARTLLVIPPDVRSNGFKPPIDETGNPPYTAQIHKTRFGDIFGHQSIRIMCDSLLMKHEISDFMIRFLSSLYGEIKKTADFQGSSNVIGEPAFYLLCENLREEIAGGEYRLHFFPGRHESDREFWAVAAVSKEIRVEEIDNYKTLVDMLNARNDTLSKYAEVFSRQSGGW
jgi:transcriptional regulator with XRE-family HTH domain